MIKWLLVFGLLAIGIVANYYYRDVAWALRLTGWIVLCIAALGVAATTAKGQSVWSFGKEARMELRKVVWPSRQETVQSTFVVVALVFAMSILMWGVDSLLVWAFKWFAGV